jgi:hypothetical protein
MDSIRKVGGLLALAVFSLGLSSCCTAAANPAPPPQNTWHKTKCDSKAHDNNIDVGTDVGCKLAMVYHNNVINWKAVDSKMYVKITMDDPDAFKNMKGCDGTQNQCTSGMPTRPGNANWVYLYTASLCDSGGACTDVTDPGIIIVP